MSASGGLSLASQESTARPFVSEGDERRSKIRKAELDAARNPDLDISPLGRRMMIAGRGGTQAAGGQFGPSSQQEWVEPVAIKERTYPSQMPKRPPQSFYKKDQECREKHENIVSWIWGQGEADDQVGVEMREAVRLQAVNVLQAGSKENGEPRDTWQGHESVETMVAEADSDLGSPDPSVVQNGLNTLRDSRRLAWAELECSEEMQEYAEETVAEDFAASFVNEAQQRATAIDSRYKDELRQRS